LTDLDLGALTSVGGSLRIMKCLVSSLSGLSALASVGDLDVMGNRALKSIDGLGALSSIGGDLTVRDNPQLPQCEACELLGQLVEPPGSFVASDNQPDTCSDTCT
jgi:hypothetical protein